jgi:N-acetylglucosaminyldiphosphoundecaprenol N-acetyl-beta-D-mannosaminyltransferase
MSVAYVEPAWADDSAPALEPAIDPAAESATESATALATLEPASPGEREHADGCPTRQHIRPRVTLFGVPADALDMAGTVDAVRRLVACGAPHQHVCLNAAKIVELDARPDLKRAVANCDLISVDGQAVVWASRALGSPVPERVAGIDLFQALLAEAAEAGWPVYLLGAKDEVVRRTAEVAVERYPGLQIAGFRDGYWTPDEEPEVVADVARSGAKLLFLAIPSPRKELFLEQHATALGVPFRMGVGGSFDVLAGVTTRAPRWMQRLGLEWFHRLVQEPRRMARRYIVGNTAFIRLTLQAKRA